MGLTRQRTGSRHSPRRRERCGVDEGIKEQHLERKSKRR